MLHRGKIIVFAVLSVALIGVSAAVIAQEQGKQRGPAAPPDRDRVAQSRYEAALASKEREEERIAQAKQRYEKERTETSLVPRHYLASLESPVSAEALFIGFSEVSDLVPETIFTWLQAPGSPTPTTAEIQMADLGWPSASAQEMSSALRTMSLDYLRWKLDVINDAPGSNKKAQEGEIRQLITMVKQEGVLTFAFRCSCSPSSLDQLKAAVRTLEYRAVELAEDRETPIWPNDRLRDLILQTKGHYGRVKTKSN